jgi:hypothetical protein
MTLITATPTNPPVTLTPPVTPPPPPPPRNSRSFLGVLCQGCPGSASATLFVGGTEVETREFRPNHEGWPGVVFSFRHHVPWSVRIRVNLPPLPRSSGEDWALLLWEGVEPCSYRWLSNNEFEFTVAPGHNRQPPWDVQLVDRSNTLWAQTHCYTP